MSSEELRKVECAHRSAYLRLDGFCFLGTDSTAQGYVTEEISFADDMLLLSYCSWETQILQQRRCLPFSFLVSDI